MSIVSRLRNPDIILLGYVEDKKTEAQRHKVTWSKLHSPKGRGGARSLLSIICSALSRVGLGEKGAWEQEDHKRHTNHWTNLRRAETKRKKEFNIEAWEKETSNTIS